MWRRGSERFVRDKTIKRRKSSESGSVTLRRSLRFLSLQAFGASPEEIKVWNGFKP